MAAEQYRVKQRDIALVDRQTGEVIEGVDVAASVKKTSGRRYTQHTTDFDGYKADLQSRRLRSAVLVADALAAAADRWNRVEASARGFAKNVGLTRQTVGKVINVLLADDFIRRVPNPDKPYLYMVSPEYVLKIGAEDVWKVAAAWDELPRTVSAAQLATLADEYDRLGRLLEKIAAERERIARVLASAKKEPPAGMAGDSVPPETDGSISGSDDSTGGGGCQGQLYISDVDCAIHGGSGDG